MYYYVTFLTSTVAANHLSILFFRLVCSSGWFVLPVGLCFRLVCASGWFVRMYIVPPILTIILRILEA